MSFLGLGFNVLLLRNYYYYYYYCIVVVVVVVVVIIADSFVYFRRSPLRQAQIWGD